MECTIIIIMSLCSVLNSSLDSLYIIYLGLHAANIRGVLQKGGVTRVEGRGCRAHKSPGGVGEPCLVYAHF